MLASAFSENNNNNLYLYKKHKSENHSLSELTLVTSENHLGKIVVTKLVNKTLQNGKMNYLYDNTFTVRRLL